MKHPPRRRRKRPRERKREGLTWATVLTQAKPLLVLASLAVEVVSLVRQLGL